LQVKNTGANSITDVVFGFGGFFIFNANSSAIVIKIFNIIFKNINYIKLIYHFSNPTNLMKILKMVL